MRNVVLVPQDELQGVLAGRQLDCCFGLAAAKVLVVLVGRDRCAIIFKLLINDQVMVPGFGFFNAGWRDAHSRQTKMDRYRTGDFSPVGGSDKIDFRAFRRGCLGKGCSGKQCACQRAEKQFAMQGLVIVRAAVH